MIRYRDMTFCESLSCITPLCPLRLTPDVYIEARKWWVGMSGEPPVAVADSPVAASPPPPGINKFSTDNPRRTKKAPPAGGVRRLKC